MQHVEPFKDNPGGLYPAKHQAIIELHKWYRVQEKMKRPQKTKVVVADELPLRGCLKCYCGKKLTGTPSKGKMGKYYYYYKCDKTTHNNISAIKAPNQMLEIQAYVVAGCFM